MPAFSFAEGLLVFGEDLALFVMKAKKNNLDVRAGVLSGDEAIVSQLLSSAITHPHSPQDNPRRSKVESCIVHMKV